MTLDRDVAKGMPLWNNDWTIFPTKIFPNYQSALVIMIKVFQIKKLAPNPHIYIELPLKWNYSFVHPFTK